jgi:hypothetical protein
MVRFAAEDNGRRHPFIADTREADELREAALVGSANLAHPADLSGRFLSCSGKNNAPVTMFPQKGFTCDR